MKRIQRYKFPIITLKSNGDVIYSIRNIVNKIVITLYGDDAN